MTEVEKCLERKLKNPEFAVLYYKELAEDKQELIEGLKGLLREGMILMDESFSDGKDWADKVRGLMQVNK